MSDVSSQKYYVPVLRYLLEHGTVKKYDLRHIVKSSGTMDKLLPKLEAEGLISMKEEILGRRTYLVSLTDKGQAVAEQLKKAEQVAEGREISEFLTDDMKILIFLLSEKEARYESLKEKFGSAYSSVSRLKQMKLIDVRIDNKKYPSEEIISLTDKGRKVAQKLKEIEEVLSDGL